MYQLNLVAIFIIFFLNITYSYVIENKENLPEKYFIQRLDHHNKRDERRWKQVKINLFT